MAPSFFSAFGGSKDVKTRFSRVNILESARICQQDDCWRTLVSNAAFAMLYSILAASSIGGIAGKCDDAACADPLLSELLWWSMYSRGRPGLTISIRNRRS
jgi:hypothetical protein